MASYTPNYNLKKPAGTDVVDIADLNGNMDIVDTQLNSLNSKFTNYTDITATTSETGSISLSNTTPWFSSSAVLTGAHIVGSVTAIDAFVMLVRSSAGNWFAKVFNWDMTPVKNTEVRIRVYGV